MLPHRPRALAPVDAQTAEQVGKGALPTAAFFGTAVIAQQAKAHVAEDEEAHDQRIAGCRRPGLYRAA